MPVYQFTLNGKQVSVDAPGDLSVLWALRDKLGVTGVKYGCGINVCQACTSHLGDREEFNPCITNLRDVAGKRVTTIEGLADGDVLHPVQEAWLEQDVAQCGFCQPGQIMAAVALLKRTSNPTDADIDKIENVCRCGTYFRVRKAIKSAAATMAARGGTSTVGSGSVVPAVAAGSAGSGPVTAVGTLPTTGAAAGAAVAGAAALGAAALGRHLLDSGNAANPA